MILAERSPPDADLPGAAPPAVNPPAVNSPAVNSLGRRTVLITGGTAGLGLALVRHFAATGAIVYAVARQPRTLAEIAGDVRFIDVDFAAAEANVPIAVRLAADGVQRLHLLIHNAADGWYGAPELMPASRAEAVLTTNVWAPILLTQSLATRLEAAGGKVVFIGSIAAFLPAPRYAVYAATKAAVDGFARSLRVELSGRIAVQVVHPGPIRTSFHQRVGAIATDTRRFDSAELVARQVVAAIARDQGRGFVHWRFALLAMTGRIAAGLIDRLARIKLRRELQRG